MDMHQNGSAAWFRVSVSPISLYSVLTDGGYWGSGQVVAVTVTPKTPEFDKQVKLTADFQNPTGTPYVTGSGVDTLGRLP